MITRYRSPITRDVFAKKEKIEIEKEKGESLDHQNKRPKILTDIMSSLADLKLPNFSNKTQLPSEKPQEPQKFTKKTSTHPNVALSHQNFLNVFSQVNKNDYLTQLERVAGQSSIGEYIELEFFNTTTSSIGKIVYVPAMTLFSYEVA